MIICDYYSEYREKRIVLGLGYFDSVHKGHTHLIREVERMASELNALPAVFTFRGNPFEVIGKSQKNIFSFEERVRRLGNIGVELVIGAPASREFFAMTGDEFLDTLTRGFDVVGFVSGTDYTYGDHAMNNAESLCRYARARGIRVETVDLVEKSGKKIASRDIRTLLEAGDITAVNELLSEPYSITAPVKSGRHDGQKIGFPTANMDIDSDTLGIKRGVYSAIALIDGVRYRAITNIGGHPTFGDDRENIESFILDFEGDLYGKTITIMPMRYLRDVRRFDTVEELRRVLHDNEMTTRREVEL